MMPLTQQASDLRPCNAAIPAEWGTQQGLPKLGILLLHGNSLAGSLPSGWQTRSAPCCQLALCVGLSVGCQARVLKEDQMWQCMMVCAWHHWGVHGGAAALHVQRQAGWRLMQASF